MTKEKLKQVLVEVGLNIQEIYEENERERFGPEKRDLIWINAFSKK